MKKTIITGMIVAMMMLVVIPAALAGSWSGNILNAFNSTPIYNVTVTATLGPNSSIASTSAIGHFKVDNLLNGSYTLTYTASGYITKTRSGLPAINNSDPARTDLVWPFNETMTPDGTACNQSVAYGTWGSCTGTRSRSVTYTNYNNICGYRYVTSQSQNCDDGSGSGSGSNGGSGSGGTSGTSGSLVSKTVSCIDREVSVAQNDKILVKYKGTNYTFFVKDIVTNAVVTKLYPVPSRDFQLKKGTAKMIDLDWNNKNDLKIEVTEVVSNMEARVKCSFSNEPDTNEGDGQEEQQEDTPLLQNVKEGILSIASDVVPKDKPSPIVGSVIALAIIVLGLLGYSLYKRSREDKEDEDEF